MQAEVDHLRELLSKTKTDHTEAIQQLQGTHTSERSLHEQQALVSANLTASQQLRISELEKDNERASRSEQALTQQSHRVVVEYEEKVRILTEKLDRAQLEYASALRYSQDEAETRAKALSDQASRLARRDSHIKALKGTKAHLRLEREQVRILTEQLDQVHLEYLSALRRCQDEGDGRVEAALAAQASQLTEACMRVRVLEEEKKQQLKLATEAFSLKAKKSESSAAEIEVLKVS